jgi:hypothetical protein
MRAISQIPVAFPFQSYFDSTLEEKAILSQPTNELIVPSTKKTSQGVGYVVGVAGFSTTPVAFRFFGGFNDTGVVILRPGQSMRIGRFLTFDYGLPFGWLGGGRSVIYVGHTPETQLDLGGGRPELVFHRARLAIEASGANLPTLKRNWPLQFPWSRTIRGTDSVDQKGNPILRVEPTRALLRLRSQIAVDKIVSFVFRGSREFDEASDGTFTLTNLTSAFAEVQFKASTDPSLALYPTAELPESLLHLACDEGGITALDLGDAALTAVEIDIVRFGRI